MNRPLLKIENLSVEYEIDNEIIKGVNDLNLSINEGERLGIIGESGSGKTSMAMAIMGLIKAPGIVKGSICYDEKDINKLSKDELNTLRWKKIAIVFQNSLDVLNPLLTIHEQIYEVVIRHTELSKSKANKKVIALLKSVGLNSDLKNCYPHQLSGGMRQRVLIAMAIACDPELLILDEPTSALDTISKNEIIELILNLYEKNKFALLAISHELDTILKLTSRMAVMYSGSIVEKGHTLEIIKNPMHTYTRGLLNSSPSLNPYADLWGIPNRSKKLKNIGCPFRSKCTQSIELCKKNKPKLKYISLEREVACNRGGIVTLLQGKDIEKTYKYKGKTISACKNCEIEIKSGEVIVLIGKSGSGKTTLAGILAGIIKPNSGYISFDNTLVSGNNFTSKENGIQMVFQDPFSAINENLNIREVIGEPLEIIKKYSHDEIEEKIIKVLEEVQLPKDKKFLLRKCHTLSGGQRQRVALARSLIMEPKLLIADEISSMLDPSTQANILRLLKKLQNEKGFSMLYITHDLGVARKIANKVYVMNNGKILERGNSVKIFSQPENDYTKKLVEKGFNFLF